MNNSYYNQGFPIYKVLLISQKLCEKSAKITIFKIQYVSKISCMFSKQNYNKTATKSKFWSNKIMILLLFCFDFVAFLL